MYDWIWRTYQTGVATRITVRIGAGGCSSSRRGGGGEDDKLAVIDGGGGRTGSSSDDNRLEEEPNASSSGAINRPDWYRGFDGNTHHNTINIAIIIPTCIER